jgi:hypothetical protein
MTRVNRPDTLLTELRELRRRLRLLEGSRMRVAAPIAALRTRAGTVTALLPARPADWPSTTSADWEPLLDATASGTLVVRAVADAGTTGAARVVVDGEVAGDEIAVTDEVVRTTVQADGADLVVEARRTGGSGQVHVQAWLT